MNYGFGDVYLSKSMCNSSKFSTYRCPLTFEFLNLIGVGNGGHIDLGDLVFDPTVEVDACPIAVAIDGGVYLNLSPDQEDECSIPQRTEPKLTPHGLWVYDISGYKDPTTKERPVLLDAPFGVYGSFEFTDDIVQIGPKSYAIIVFWTDQNLAQESRVYA